MFVIIGRRVIIGVNVRTRKQESLSLLILIHCNSFEVIGSFDMSLGIKMGV
jgi:hypothetical protein